MATRGVLAGACACAGIHETGLTAARMAAASIRAIIVRQTSATTAGSV
jgi:hypothetical protein